MELTDIKNALRRGDIAEIVLRTDYSRSYVKQVLDPANPRTNTRILEVAEEIAQDRKRRLVNNISKAMN